MSRSTTSILLLMCGVSLLLMTGCNDESEPVDEFDDYEGLTVAETRFGEPYEIITQESPSSVEVPPGLTQDSLFVVVGYEGGCADHSFALYHETAQDTTRLWLEHDAPRDDCDEYIRDDLSWSAPANIDQSSIVLLLNPQGYEPHVLRWGTTE